LHAPKAPIMPTHREIATLQACASNRIAIGADPALKIAGVIGIAPSRYSKSPDLWNAAFAATGINAVYIPLDLEGPKLGELARWLRETESALGINVTVPHKLGIIDFLDELDSRAARVGAVNTVVRSRDGRLIGYNTDGPGFIFSVLEPQPGTKHSFVKELRGARVLLLGAGGSARAVAFQLGEYIDDGSLIICNRTVAHAVSLAKEIGAAGTTALAIGEEELAEHAPVAALIVNSTLKGQGSSPLEKFSALAPVSQDTGDRDAIEINNRRSLELAAKIPKQTRFYDLIYHPEETVFLRHARATGHQVMNGKAMIIGQAAFAFVNHICAQELQRLGLNPAATLPGIIAAMCEAW
jgi:shikimate dehydrogenase